MPWIRQTFAEVDALFAELRAKDRFGHRLHLTLAMAACFLGAFPTTWLEWAWWPVFACCCVRMISHHRILGPLVWEWPVRLTIAWVAWGALSLAWTAGSREAWLTEWGVARYAVFLFALWPVMNERRWLIGALAAGVLMGNLSQLGHAVGAAAGVEWLVWPRLEGRNSGWWDPVVGGSILCGAFGLHLAGCVLGRSVRERAVGGALCVVTLAAIAATGTRGAWIGAGALTGLVLMIAAWRFVLRPASAEQHTRQPRRRATGATAAAMVAAAVVLGGAGAAVVWFAAGDTVARRVQETREELARAMEGDYSTFTGARLAMWGWAGRAFATHPVQGVGMGGYKAWVEGEMSRQEGATAKPAPAVHAHAHSMPAHSAAATGVIGTVLLGGLIVICVRNGLREGAGPACGYDAGPALAILGLVCAGMFDTIQVNQQTTYWLWVLVAMCMLRRPAAAGTTGGAG